jgi:hypothetical protein
MTAQQLEIPLDEIARLCGRYQVHELALFGSQLTEASRPDSDVDLLVEFRPEAEIGFLSFSRLQRELSELFRRDVDLVPKAGLKPAIRQHVLAEARVLYAE